MLTTPKININAPPGNFLEPEDLPRCNLLSDKEIGSLELGDPTGGLSQAVWRCWFEDGFLKVQRLATDELPIGDIIVVQEIEGEVTEISVTFDSNMRVHIVYIEEGVTKLYWYNTQTAQNEIRIFEAASSPRLCLDDKRDKQSANRDILFYYLQNGALYARQQRDRYDIEYLIFETNAVRIGQVGMGRNNRVQIELIYSDSCGEEGNFLIFTPVIDAEISTYYLSDIVTSDICIMPRSPVSITGGEYRINSGAWTSVSKYVMPTDTLQIRVLSSDLYETTVSAILTVGWYSGSYSVTTIIEPTE